MPERASAIVVTVAGLLAIAAPARAMERLTLEQAVARALARNPNVLVAAAEVRRAEALVAEARSSSLPTLFPSGSYTRLDAARSFMGIVALPKDQWAATAPLSVPLIAPQAWTLWAHSLDDRKVATLDLGQVRRQVGIAVANTFLTVVTLRRVLEVAVAGRDNAAAHAEYTRQQHAGGTISELDAVRALQQLHTTQGQVENARVALARAQEALGVLVAGDQPIDAAETPRFPVPDTRGWPERRADILWLRMRQTAARNQVKDGYTGYLPYVSGVFQPIFTEPPSFTQPRWGWQLTITLVLPVYDGGLREGRRLERSALLEEATDNLTGALRAANSDIRLAAESIVLADSRVRETKAAADLARQALEISTLRYRQGATSNIEVIDAEQQSRQSDLSAALAEDNAQQARLDLLSASGAFP